MKFRSLALALVALAACNTDRTTAPEFSSDATMKKDADVDNGPNEGRGEVYVLSNQVDNHVLSFRRSPSGELSADGAFATGGNGTGAGLGSGNALSLSPDGDLLFAVNAGSNTVSSFRVTGGNLHLVGTVSSGGVHPISVTAARGLVYVLNDGGSGNISGIRYNDHGALTPIANSSRPLSSAASAPAQIQFTSDADRLIVTEKGTNMIGSYYVAPNGLASPGQFTASSGQTPFGFAFRSNVLIVAEAFGGAAGASAASSYSVGAGPLAVISASVPTTETSACWTTITANGQFAFVANTGSGTVTGYAISAAGALTRLVANGESAVIGAGSGPADIATSSNGGFLYTRNGGNRTISAMRVHADGSLTVLSGGVAGLPAGTAGIVAR